MINGLRGLRPAIPVPWSIEIFSSRVISLTTMDARSSGERLAFIHGCGLSLDFAGDWAAAVGRRLRVEIRKKKSRVHFKYTCERRRMVRPPVVSKIVIVAGARNSASDFGTSSGNSHRARAGAEKGRRVLHWRGEDCPGAD